MASATQSKIFKAIAAWNKEIDFPKIFMCIRCLGVWPQRFKDLIPQRCAHCNSPYWNVPYKIKVVK